MEFPVLYSILCWLFIFCMVMCGLPWQLSGKESTCNVGDAGVGG